MRDHHSGSSPLITERYHWSSHERNRKNLPHSRYLEPSFCLDSNDTNGIKSVQFVIYVSKINFLRFRRKSPPLLTISVTVPPLGLSGMLQAAEKLFREKQNRQQGRFPQEFVQGRRTNL